MSKQNQSLAVNLSDFEAIFEEIVDVVGYAKKDRKRVLRILTQSWTQRTVKELFNILPDSKKEKLRDLDIETIDNISDIDAVFQNVISNEDAYEASMTALNLTFESYFNKIESTTSNDDKQKIIKKLHSFLKS